MEISIEQLKEVLSRLPTHDRGEIVEFLLESLERDDAAFEKEIDRRFAEIESGQVVGIPVEDFLAEMRAKYP